MLFRPLTAACLMACLALPAVSQSIDFGDDSGDYARDGECDDRRFFGPGTAPDVTTDHIGRDATDCRRLLSAGSVTVWDYGTAQAATSCIAINFGNDTSDYANDAECDDPRFEGMGSAATLLQSDRGRDATDCRQLCEMGVLFIRDHGTY